MITCGAIVIIGVALALVNTPHHSTSTSTTTTTLHSLASTTTTTPTVTISAVGDTELGNTPQLPADPAAIFDGVRAALAAPIVFGNLEGTMTAATISRCAPSSTECYAFRVPPSYAKVYRAAGFNVLNSANNHSNDFGARGRLDTTAALSGAGIAQAGLPGQIAVVHDGAVKVAFVDFAPYYNTNDLLDPGSAAGLIARAKTLANVVVVYMHAGAEGPNADHVTRASETYYGENRGNPYVFAHAAIDDGADLVIASGPHVLRGLEWYRGHLIDYSLGDFANYYDFATVGNLRLSAILHVTLALNGTFVSGHFTSLTLSAAGTPSLDPSGAAAGLVNRLSTQDFAATRAVIGRRGELLAPLS